MDTRDLSCPRRRQLQDQHPCWIRGGVRRCLHSYRSPSVCIAAIYSCHCPCTSRSPTCWAPTSCTVYCTIASKPRVVLALYLSPITLNSFSFFSYKPYFLLPLFSLFLTFTSQYASSLTDLGWIVKHRPCSLACQAAVYPGLRLGWFSPTCLLSIHPLVDAIGYSIRSLNSLASSAQYKINMKYMFRQYHINLAA